MDIVRGATRRSEVPLAQCHARHARWAAVSACPDTASVSATVTATVMEWERAIGLGYGCGHGKPYSNPRKTYLVK